ncbi:hypothetical protein B0T18DRAFT_329560, partial [Schizothecium vesticola]
KQRENHTAWNSLTVIEPATNQAMAGLSMGERVGSQILDHLCLYVLENVGCEGTDGWSTWKAGKCR